MTGLCAQPRAQRYTLRLNWTSASRRLWVLSEHACHGRHPDARCSLPATAGRFSCGLCARIPLLLQTRRCCRCSKAQSSPLLLQLYQPQVFAADTTTTTTTTTTRSATRASPGYGYATPLSLLTAPAVAHRSQRLFPDISNLQLHLSALTATTRQPNPT